MDRLDAIIRDEITREGPIPFARFMTLALYHPTLGYYLGGGQGREPLGWNGDYFTSGDLHPLWGMSVARQLHQMWELLDRPSRFDIIEPGAGRGFLARETWRYTLAQAPDWLPSLRYTLIDHAPAENPLRIARERRLRDTLAAWNVPADSVRWVSDVSQLEGDLVGCVVSNELVDALPVHIVESQSGELSEVFVAIDEASGRFIETLRPPASSELARYLDTYHIPWRDYPDGWRAEICMEATPWLQRTTSILRRGFALTIDYGDTARRLYTPTRPSGTLAAYSRHHLSGDALAHPGAQDITAHVNFSALIQAGRAVGLRFIALPTQAQFLQRLGIRQEEDALAKRLYPAADTARHTDQGQADHLRRMSLHNAVTALLDPHGLGGFRVLLQQRDVPDSAQTLLGAQPCHTTQLAT